MKPGRSENDERNAIESAPLDVKILAHTDIYFHQLGATYSVRADPETPSNVLE